MLLATADDKTRHEGHARVRRLDESAVLRLKRYGWGGGGGHRRYGGGWNQGYGGWGNSMGYSPYSMGGYQSWGWGKK
uniref:Uncharacterized protein n=1 Tax=Acrobeloides nanus TaxID=290746 RepID=A0A914C592_9BILA